MIDFFYCLSVCLGLGLGQLKLKGFYVEWKDIADVWLYWNDVKSRIIRNVGEKIGFSSGIILQCHIAKITHTVMPVNANSVHCT